MDLSKMSIKKIRELIVFTALLVVALWKFDVVLGVLKTIWDIIFPFVLGGAIAFLTNVPMSFLEKKIFGRAKKENKIVEKLARPISLLLTIVLIVGVIALVMFGVILQLTRTIVGFLVSGVATFFIAFSFACYILFQKEQLHIQIRKVCFAFLSKQKANALLKICSLIYRTFANFLTGQCLEAVILGSMFAVTLSILKMPYALLIGTLIAFTALIPIFGAFIGCAVGCFLIFMVSPKQAMLFILVFLLLQQIEGNLIYPHVVGGSVGLPSIWVLAAVTIGGNLMGIAGMLIFIPLASVCYTVFREVVYLRLKEKHIKRVTTTAVEEYTAQEWMDAEKKLQEGAAK